LKSLESQTGDFFNRLRKWAALRPLPGVETKPRES